MFSQLLSIRSEKEIPLPRAKEDFLAQECFKIKGLISYLTQIDALNLHSTSINCHIYELRRWNSNETLEIRGN